VDGAEEGAAISSTFSWTGSGEDIRPLPLDCRRCKERTATTRTASLRHVIARDEKVTIGSVSLAYIGFSARPARCGIPPRPDGAISARLE
jgi:hypothetical protein